MRRNQCLLFLTGLSLAVLLTAASAARAGGGGDGTPGTFRLCAGGPEAGLECNTAADCFGGSACVDTSFLPDLPRICQGGGSAGRACDSEADCGTGVCGIDFTTTLLLAIRGIVTLIVDDEETNIETEEACGAATVLLEVRKAGQTYFLPQTYLCIPETDVDIEFLRTEIGLSEAVIDASLLTRLLFRSPDGGAEDPAHGELAQQLRDLFGVTGRPIIVGTPTRIGPSDYTDHEGDTLASAIRLRVMIRFVQEEE